MRGWKNPLPDASDEEKSSGPFSRHSLGLIDSRGTVILASEISWGDIAAGGSTRAAAGTAPVGMGAVVGSEVEGGCSEGERWVVVGFREILPSRAGVPVIFTEAQELLLFWRSRKVSRGGGCFSLRTEGKRL